MRPPITEPNRHGVKLTGVQTFVRGIIPDAANREPDDFYPTNPIGTEALLSVERFEGEVWEPACGGGHMSEVLKAHGYRVTSTDLVDRGYGRAPVDFLRDVRTVDNVITNPPYKLAEEFAAHALARTTGKVALLCRLAWLEGIQRKRFFQASPLARVWVFSRRLAMQRGKICDTGGMIAFAWYVWEHGHRGPPRLGWLDHRDLYDGREDARRGYEVACAAIAKKLSGGTDDR